MSNSLDIGALVKANALAYQLPPQLVIGVIAVESGGDVYAWNPEPKYRYFWNVKRNSPFRKVTSAEIDSKVPPRDFPALAGDRDQEWWGQQASWGLMQLMGAVARERGFKGKYLPEICTPEINIQLGCAHLAQYKRRYFDQYGWPGVCRAFNGGGYAAKNNTNPEYPKKVLAAIGGEWPSV